MTIETTVRLRHLRVLDHKDEQRMYIPDLRNDMIYDGSKDYGNTKRPSVKSDADWD